MIALILCLLAAFAIVFIIIALLFMCMWIPMYRMFEKESKQADKTH